jgi:signal transduction histidine kinase
LLAFAGALVLNHQARIQRNLVRAHARTLAARAEELEQFAGRVAHDIRNPLSTARMAAELVLRRTAEEPVRTLAQRMTRNLSEADSILGALLDFARSGAKPEPGASTSPGDLLNDLVKDLSREAAQARIHLILEPVPLVTVACSVGVYLSLVGNLVRNAIKYMGDSPQRQIRIRVSEGGASVRTEVIDSGPGIPEESRGALFEPYFRGPSQGREGLGLGLATVRKLAEGHHGSAGVSSTRGEGSTFWFELPRAGAIPSNDAEDEPRSEGFALPH